MNEFDPLRFLVYFDRAVLQHLRNAPDRYVLREDDMGGRVESRATESGDVLQESLSVRFAFRRLENGHVCVAAYGPDLARMSDRQRAIWRGHALIDLSFAAEDPAFDRWVRRYLEGSWNVHDGPLPNLRREVEQLRALTNQTVSLKLWRAEWNPLIAYPVAENTDAYAKACLELYRVLIDSLDGACLARLAQRLNTAISDEKKPLNSLREILPALLVPHIHRPLRKLADVRNRLHGLPSGGITPFAAFNTFHKDVVNLLSGLGELKAWLENALGVSADVCLRREKAMAAWLPKFVGPPRPEFKLAEVQRAVGKTIERVDFGEEAPHPDVHMSEAIVLHFTDGSAMILQVGSNAWNVSLDHEGLRPSEFSTDLMAFWVPALMKKDPE